MPLVPGSDGAIEDVDEAKRLAKDIGYPVIIKAASGGGGRGMKVVNSEEELETQMQQAGTEAKAAFGDATVYLEKYLGNPRHIEFQVFGDGEWQCHPSGRARLLASAPPPESAGRSALPVISTQRNANGWAASWPSAMADMGYRGAGTIEFLWENGEFYFIEMNTRIQVEHPVTEMITGFDLVREQIRVAQGNGLSVRQEDLEFRGHAMECRINAEDPRTFAPSPGTIKVNYTPTRRHACPRR
jgi:acetyl-CoA carboxylase biotin carboxylase subunit